MAPPPQVFCLQHTTPAGERKAFSSRLTGWTGRRPAPRVSQRVRPQKRLEA